MRSPNERAPGAQEKSSIAAPRVEDLRGLWRRALILWPDGRRDETTEVRWLQGIRSYIDLRQPAGLPDLKTRRGLEDLTFEDCAALATQEGFAGDFSYDGTHFEWARRIDFQPKPLYSDAGSLHFERDVLIERGRDVDYIEHWLRDPNTAHFATVAVKLAERGSGTRAALLRVGSLFMFARDRRIEPTAQMTLPECIAEASSLAIARALVDCEISFGEIVDDHYRIRASTLPYRVGDALAPRRSGTSLSTADRTVAGDPMARHWDVLDTEGDAQLLEPRTK